MARRPEDIAGARRPRRDERDDQPVYIISVAAELAGVHPQTLRIYERKGLLSPARTAGNTRRYSDRDIRQLQMIQRLTQEHGINLAGVKMIVEMENELDRLRSEMQRLDRELDRSRRRMREEVKLLREAQGRRAEIVPRSALHQLRMQLKQVERDARRQVETRGAPIPVGPAETEER